MYCWFVPQISIRQSLGFTSLYSRDLKQAVFSSNKAENKQISTTEVLQRNLPRRPAADPHIPSLQKPPELRKGDFRTR